MDLNQRLTQIEARLQEIESRLGIEHDDSDDNNSADSSSGRTEPWISSSPSPSV